MKTRRSIGFDPSVDYHRYKIMIRPEKDDSVDVSRLYLLLHLVYCIKSYSMPSSTVC